jgi:hypothetical protein
MRLKLEVFVVLCLLGLATSMSLKLERSRRDLAIASQLRDSLLIEDAASRAKLDGWEVRFGQREEELGNMVARRDSISARLARSLDKANARILSLTTLTAILKDSLTSLGTPGDTTSTGAVTYHGAINDGLLDASWRFLAPSLSLAYRVSVPLEIVTSEGGDGRWLVTARATDARAAVSVGEFWFSPAPPVQVSKCTLKQTGLRFGIGILAGVLAPRVY